MTAYAKGNVSSLPGKSSVALDFVTADYVADAMAEIAGDEDTIGHRYHLCAGPEKMTTLAEIVDTSARYFDREKLSLISLEEFERFRSHVAENGTATDLELLEELDLYVTYLNTTVRFDITNTESVLSDSGLASPPFRAYFDKVARRISEQA
jgi:nucleoside-diphosphate-sugar epimerase